MFTLNTIFKKQFFFFFGTLVLSFTLLGIALTYVFSQYFISKTKQGLGDSLEKIVKIYYQSYEDDGEYLESHENITLDNIHKNSEEALDAVSEVLNSTYILTDENFNIIKNSGSYMVNRELKVQIPEIEGIREGNGSIIYNKSNFYGIFKEQVYSASQGIFMNGEFKGTLTLVSGVPDIESSVSDISRVTLVAIVISGGVAFLLIYISSRTISMPLYEMNEAAKIIASGDFERRIEITSNDEVGQLAESFNQMAESLQTQELQRRSFIANISHDLRSPLTSMRGFLSAILDGTVPENRQERYLRIILDETDRLSKLANDILDINKVEIIELHLTVFDINEMIRKTIIQFEKRILDKNIKAQVVLIDEITLVKADSEKIQRVLHNLLDNAIKFTEAGENIKVETYEDDKKVYISVKDTGIGLSDKDQKNMFERFYKADSSRGIDKKGSGLGLSIIKEFIKAHNETITVFSEKGKGTEIIFSLKHAEIKEGIIIQ